MEIEDKHMLGKCIDMDIYNVDLKVIELTLGIQRENVSSATIQLRVVLKIKYILNMK